MKALIFGANGQDGHYLGPLLEREGVEVIGVARSGTSLLGDVADRDFVEGLIKLHHPEYVFHLAAASTTRHEAVFENHAAISTGSLNILEAVYGHSPQSKVFLAGSAMQFENHGEPIDENTRFAARSAYAVSRIQSVYAARYYRSLSLRVYVGYLFNHDSPLRGPGHISQKIAQAARAGTAIEVGDIGVKKEFNFAGDIVAAIWRLVGQDDIFEAVIGSGRAHTIEEWLELCFGEVDKNWQDYVTISKSFTAEYQVLVSRPDLIYSLGWTPRIDINGLATMMTRK